MKNKKNLNLKIQCEEVSQMEKSIFSQIGNNGLRFLKQDVQITPQGLTTIQGNISSSLLPTTKQNLLVSDTFLGKGAAGSVQAGIYKPLNIPVAIKGICVYDQGKRHQIMNDIKIFLQNQIQQQKIGFKCNFIVTLYGAYFDQGYVKIILELMDIGSLQHIIKIYKTARISPNINQQILSKIALQILCGLAYLHTNNYLHRDIKPANVLINSLGQVKLTDFGISKQIQQGEQFTKTSVGTRSYMSPQRIKGKQYGYKSDVWGFGLIMYQLATGDSLYQGKSQFDMIKSFEQNQLNIYAQNYSEQFNDFLQCCLKVKQSERQSAYELLGHRWIMLSTKAKNKKQIKDWLIQLKTQIVPLV